MKRKLSSLPYEAGECSSSGSRRPDGDNFSAVMPYDGNVLAVGGFSFFCGNVFCRGGKTKIWRKYFGGMIMPYGHNFSAVSGFSFFGGNVNGD